MGATTGPGGGLLLADVAVGLLTGVVGPPGVLHEAGSVSASPPQRLAPELPHHSGPLPSP